MFSRSTISTGRRWTRNAALGAVSDKRGDGQARGERHVLVDDGVHRAIEQKALCRCGQVVTDQDDVEGPPTLDQRLDDAAIAAADAVDANHVVMAVEHR